MLDEGFAGTMGDLEVVISDKTPINRYFDLKEHVGYYNYPLLDEWYCQLNLEKIILAEKVLDSPVCLDGERAAPPESCGGVKGYQQLIKARKQPKHRDYKLACELLGDNFDPEAFDKGKVVFSNPADELKRFKAAIHAFTG